jgi:hypothetical protein
MVNVKTKIQNINQLYREKNRIATEKERYYV